MYFEVGGTTTNIGVIKNGRPAIDYSVVGGHRTYISSLDVRVLGVAGGSMIQVNKSGVHDVAHVPPILRDWITPYLQMRKKSWSPGWNSFLRRREIRRITWLSA